MKAISVMQPWAWAIVAGHKRVENRSWRTSYRGPLAIHAGKSHKWMTEGLRFLRSQGIEPPEEFDFGAVLGMVELYDCRPVGEVVDPFAFGPQCFLLRGAKMLKTPVPYAGQLAFFFVEA